MALCGGGNREGTASLGTHEMPCPGSTWRRRGWAQALQNPSSGPGEGPRLPGRQTVHSKELPSAARGSRCDFRLRPHPARREAQPGHRHLNTYLQYRRSAAPEVFPRDPEAVLPKHQQVPLCWTYRDYDFPALLLLFLLFPKFTLKGEALMIFRLI